MESGDHGWRTHGVHRVRICHFTVRKNEFFHSQAFWSRTATRRSGLVAHERTNACCPSCNKKNSWPALHALLISSAAFLRQLSADKAVLWSRFRVIVILLAHCGTFWKQHFEEHWNPRGESQKCKLVADVGTNVWTLIWGFNGDGWTFPSFWGYKLFCRVRRPRMASVHTVPSPPTIFL